MDIPELANLHDKQFHKMQIMLPYGGRTGNKLMIKVKKHLKKLLSKDIKTIVTHQSKRLSAKFQVK